MKATLFQFSVPCPGKTCNVLRTLKKQQCLTAPAIDIIFDNKASLAQLYNEEIKIAIDRNVDWLVLMHNDIELENFNVCERVLESGYDVVGVAGTRSVKLQEPALWHLMGGGFNSGRLRGAVAHGTMSKKNMTAFGPYPGRCVMLDGVFLAINRKVFEKVQFDESNPAKFHFYDLDYTLSCHKNGFKVGVGDIQITHESPGLKEYSGEWLDGQRWFLNKHNDERRD